MTHLELDELADVLCREAEVEATEHAMTCPTCSAALTDLEADRKSTRLNSSHPRLSRMPSSA